MRAVRDGKKIGTDNAHNAPIARLRARFGSIGETPPLTPSTPARVAAKPKLPDPQPNGSPWDLPPELYERWEERVCIMHFDGKLSWREAEALALADVLGQQDLHEYAGKPAT